MKIYLLIFVVIYPVRVVNFICLAFRHVNVIAISNFDNNKFTWNEFFLESLLIQIQTLTILVYLNLDLNSMQNFLQPNPVYFSVKRTNSMF